MCSSSSSSSSSSRLAVLISRSNFEVVVVIYLFILAGCLIFTKKENKIGSMSKIVNKKKLTYLGIMG